MSSSFRLPPSSFNGFPDQKVRLTPVPGPFFTELLPEIDHLGELKVTLYTFWALDHLEGNFRALRRDDYLADARFLAGLAPEAQAPEEAAAALDEALERAVARGSLLRAQLPGEGGAESLFFLNSPRGRAALQAIQNGDWRPTGDQRQPVELDMERPNVFRLYEQNIGPLTPMIAEALRDAEQAYPAEWIEEAVRKAVENNARRWNYVEAILRSWKENGRDEPNRRDTQKDRRGYFEGELSDFIEH